MTTGWTQASSCNAAGESKPPPPPPPPGETDWPIQTGKAAQDPSGRSKAFTGVLASGLSSKVPKLTKPQQPGWQKLLIVCPTGRARENGGCFQTTLQLEVGACCLTLTGGNPRDIPEFPAALLSHSGREPRREAGRQDMPSGVGCSRFTTSWYVLELASAPIFAGLVSETQ